MEATSTRELSGEECATAYSCAFGIQCLAIWIEEGAMATVESGSYTCVLESDFAFCRETIPQGHATVRGDPVRRYCRAGGVFKRTAITFQVAPNLGSGEPNLTAELAPHPYFCARNEDATLDTHPVTP
jgi:hypothetical protein